MKWCIAVNIILLRTVQVSMQGWSLWCVYGVHLLPVYNSDMCIGIKSKHPSQDEIKEVEGFLFAKQVASACGYNLFCGSVSSEQNPVIMQ